MFMNVGYTPPPPVWPPKTKGMGLYLPQSFATPQRLTAPLQSAQIQIPNGWGMGCCASCASGGACSGHGMGLFDSGTDISGWGMPEWGLLGLGAFALYSMLSATRRGAGRVRRAVRRHRSRRAYKRLAERLGA